VSRERKVVTVVFADLLGFTSTAKQLDPEDVEGSCGLITNGCVMSWSAGAGRWRSSSAMRSSHSSA
jgi:hypothetical protein